MTGLPHATDVLIVGAGIGGATLAPGLAESGARATPAIFADGVWRPKETWRDARGVRFNPGNYYFLGGNSKFYGAVLIRYRERDFEALEHSDGLSPAWPFRYGDLEPWYAKAETMFGGHGQSGEDPTEPPRSTAFPHPPVPDEPSIAAARERLKAIGLK